MAIDTILESLLERAAAEPRSEILNFCEEGERVRHVSWQSLALEIRRYAGWFAELGVEPEQRILLLMDSGVEFWFAFLGAQHLGCTPVATSPPLVRFRGRAVLEKIAAVARQCRAALLVARKPYLELAEDLARTTGMRFVDAEAIPPSVKPTRRDPRPSSIALVQFSSGTTRTPSGVVIDQGAMLANLRALQRACGFGPGESWANWCPLYHDMGLLFSLAAIEAGMPLYFQSPLRFLGQPASWLRVLSDHRVTRTIAPNFGYAYCSAKVTEADEASLDLSAWKVAYTASEPIRRSTNEAFLRRFSRRGARDSLFAAAYGMAENTVIATCTRPGARLDFRHLRDVRAAETAFVGENAEVACVGVPVQGTEVRIVDEPGAAVPDGHVGHIEVRGTSLMRGTLGDDGSLPPPRSTRGWHRTGDLGFVDAGELFFCGRSRDVIVKAGQKIYPDFIEDALDALPAIRKGCVAAVGLEDAAAGTERVTVFAELREDVGSLADLRRTVLETVLAQTGVRVDKIVFLGPYQLQKTTSGKVQRRLTARLYEAGELELRGD